MRIRCLMYSSLLLVLLSVPAGTRGSSYKDPMGQGGGRESTGNLASRRKLLHFTHWHNSQSGAKRSIVCHSKDGTYCSQKWDCRSPRDGKARRFTACKAAEPAKGAAPRSFLKFSGRFWRLKCWNAFFPCKENPSKTNVSCRHTAHCRVDVPWFAVHCSVVLGERKLHDGYLGEIKKKKKQWK